MASRIKIFSARATSGDEAIFQQVEDEINQFMATIPDQKILAVDIKYYPKIIGSGHTSYVIAYCIYEETVV